MIEVDLILQTSHALTMVEDAPPIRNAAVAIDKTRIVAVGDQKDIASKFHARKTVSDEHALMMPGLVNGHTHAAMTCFRGMADDLELMDWLNRYIFPAEAGHVNPELAYWGSLLACAEMIKSGTTTFCDMYIFEEETACAARDANMRCLLGEVLFDFPSPSYKTVDEGLAYTRRLIEKWRDDELVNIFVEPHSLYTCSPDLLTEARNLACEYDLFIGLHLLENRAEADQLASKFPGGVPAFLKEMGLLTDRLIAFHCVCFSDEHIRAFTDHGCRVIHNPASNMKLASGVAPVWDMLKAGVPVGIGTDGCASNNTLDMIREMSTTAKLHKVFRLDPTIMDAKTVVTMATRDGAHVLGMGDLTGTLEVGKKADIIMIGLDKPHLTPMYNEYSHLVYAACGADVDTVVINGKIVMENRKLLTIDENEVMDRVSTIARRIHEGLPV